MQQLLANWPLVTVAQLMGVLLACGTDAVTWKWRPDENTVRGFNFWSLLGLLPPLVFLGWSVVAGDVGWLFYLAIWLLTVSIWLLVVAWVQAQQFEISLRTAFLGALMQLIWFFCGLLAHFVILIIVYGVLTALFSKRNPLHFGDFAAISFGSALLTHALLSLFRPTIRGAWQMWRQNLSGAGNDR